MGPRRITYSSTTGEARACSMKSSLLKVAQETASSFFLAAHRAQRMGRHEAARWSAGERGRITW